MVRHSPAAETRLTMRMGASTAAKMRRAFFNANSQAPICSTTLGHQCVFCQSGSKIALPVDRSMVSCMRQSGFRPIALNMETLHCTTLTSPVGPLFLAASERGLVALEFDARLPGQQTIRPNPRDLRSEGEAVRFEVSETRMS